MAVYGYHINSSTLERDEAAENMLLAVLPAGSIVFEGQVSFTGRRTGLLRLIEKLSPEDVLYIHSIDRLGDDTAEVIRNWKIITQKHRTGIVVLETPLINSRFGSDVPMIEVRTAAERTFAKIRRETESCQNTYSVFSLVQCAP